MNNARIVVLAIAIGAGGIAAYLASGSSEKPAPAQPVAQLQTVDILVAKSDIGLGQSVKPEDMQWQAWPSASASGSFISKTSRADAMREVTGSIARSRQSGTLSLALRSIADIKKVEEPEEPAERRGENLNVVRYGVASQQTVQK